jgi:peptidoglycan hydrolase-like protein with peptidoglycan-binding domain
VEQPAPSPPREAAVQAAAALPDKETMAGPATKQGALPRAEVREIQTLLEGFGFDPRPIDGAAGPKTQEAAMRYRQSRGGADTGAIDRQLLEVLRRDPVPPLPPRPAQVAQRQNPPPSARPSNPQVAQRQKPPPSALPSNPQVAQRQRMARPVCKGFSELG